MTAPSEQTAPFEQVRFERRGALGLVVLDRPKAINSLTIDMIRAMHEQLSAWQDDDSVAVVAITGAGEKGLCAGGDVVAMRDHVLGPPAEKAEAVSFWADEYVLDGLIGAYPKPVVAVMDGVTMGGGIGIAGHADLRIATERSKIAMPETKIGFFPDVGGLHLLARAPGELGTHMAMTGAVVTGADAVLVGIADVLVESSRIPEILSALESGTVPAPEDIGSTSHPAPLEDERVWIDACCTGDDAAAIHERLRTYDGERAEQAHEAADAMAARSPFSVSVTLEAIRRAGRLDSLDAVLAQDTVLSRAFADEPDFREGVRALLVDKDNAPAWRHDSLADVPRAEVEAAFNA
ncbi:enoyl-CoA hydratase/isomerase family protein [Mobilicoccus caccae]|uniref:3-hydroxyisobutyryl-CoA hydrolase n=1 Tax=Mobilicoccus caccae TaxID=1859295 RepID=A0ABQ6IXF0_9MICO|nr:enoyl-CoA hydratase/isomerase family protein [Mobilicoccus caccae]GMA41369.1 3-hydroxyisobutyryl-CoA hydrolase [Mobilicoccus caccae]